MRSSTAYDDMLKVAVWTGIHTGRLIPHCLYMGKTTSSAYQWMTEMGVRISMRNPEWGDDIAALAGARSNANAHHSHLYASRDMIVGTWQRIDIPLLPGLPYDYVLFTDSDVIFRRRVNLADFGYPLPPCLGMGTEMQDTPPYNAGVILMRLGCLRETYADFLAFIKSNKDGLYFPRYGPQDQGALNQFYESRITRIPKKWNAKPYHEEEPGAVIVHFHGPKPAHYIEFERSGACPFSNIATGDTKSLCAQGAAHSAPRYVAMYKEALEELSNAAGRRPPA